MESERALTAVITCPHCQTRTEAVIPGNACQFFWECPACQKMLRPKPGDCCVFCSYADRRCPTASPSR
ncbi:MAG: GDCCVxC domain-containing (seleno)protein [Gemmatimonadales bacterium]